MQPDTENRPIIIVPPAGLVCYVCAADTKVDEAKNDNNRFYYLGRIDAFELALNELREVSK